MEDNEKLDFMQKIGTMVGFIDMWADKEIQRRELLQQMLDDIYEKLMTMMDDVIALLSQGRVPVATDDKNKLVVARWFIEEALTVQAVVAELRSDMAMDGGRPGRLREFVVQHLAFKERFAGRSREYLEECFSARRIARRIADLFHLAEQHQFNVFSLLGKEARACWVGKDDGRKIEYNFTLSPEGVLSMAEDDSSGRTRPIAFFSQSPYFLDNPADQRLNIDNFLMKTLGFVAWARRQEECVTIVITSKEGRIAELAGHYAEMGFDVIPKARDLQSPGVKAFFWNLRIGYMGLYGGLDASILTGRQATIIPALRPPGWKKWSQRQLDGYMKKIAPWLDEGVSSSPLSVDPVRRDKRPVLRIKNRMDTITPISGSSSPVENTSERRIEKSVARRAPTYFKLEVPVGASQEIKDYVSVYNRFLELKDQVRGIPLAFNRKLIGLRKDSGWTKTVDLIQKIIARETGWPVQIEILPGSDPRVRHKFAYLLGDIVYVNGDATRMDLWMFTPHVISQLRLGEGRARQIDIEILRYVKSIAYSLREIAKA
ncbi:MAG: hypothetical protein KAS66_16340, partial [Candidatus Omnitrophica bacterium]|nr:hypothetical protein [Candidatus Omnitrophota bacterium]